MNKIKKRTTIFIKILIVITMIFPIFTFKMSDVEAAEQSITFKSSTNTNTSFRVSYYFYITIGTRTANSVSATLRVVANKMSLSYATTLTNAALYAYVGIEGKTYGITLKSKGDKWSDKRERTNSSAININVSSDKDYITVNSVQVYSTTTSTEYIPSVPLTTVNRNITIPLYGHYVSFNANGGQNPPGKIFKTYEGDPVLLPTEEPDKRRFEFLGWSVTASSLTYDYLPGASYEVNSMNPQTLYAVYTIAKCDTFLDITE